MKSQPFNATNTSETFVAGGSRQWTHHFYLVNQELQSKLISFFLHKPKVRLVDEEHNF